MKKSLLLFLLLLAAPGFLGAQETLTLEDYLAQVREKGPAYLRAITHRKINELNRKWVGKRWGGYIGVNGYFGDRYAGNSYSYNYGTGSYDYFDIYRYQSVSGGANLYFNNEWGLGVNTGLNYSASTGQGWYSGGSLQPWQGISDGVSASIGVPLWRNFLGTETTARDKRSFLWSDASLASNEYERLNALFEARAAYYDLSMARANLRWRREALEEYRELLKWAETHASKKDLLQARTALEGWELELESAEDGERLARNYFNRVRGVEGSRVDEGLLPLEELDGASEGAWPLGEPERLDLRSSRLYLEAMGFDRVVQEEQMKLSVNLTANADSRGFSFLNYNGYPAPPPLSYFDKVNYSIGLGVSVPLDLFSDYWTRNMDSFKLDYDRQVRDVAEIENRDTQEWDDMTIRFQASDERIGKAARLEELRLEQKEESLRLLRAGKIDFHEVVGNIGGYYHARTGKLGRVAEKLILRARAELYGAGMAGEEGK